MNTPRLTTITVAEIEQVIDLMRAYYGADRCLDDAEFAHIMTELAEAYHAAGHADASLRVGLTWLRGGTDTRAAGDARRDYEQTYLDGTAVDMERLREIAAQPLPVELPMHLNAPSRRAG